MKDAFATYISLQPYEQIMWSVAVGVVLSVFVVIFIVAYESLKGPSLHGDARWATEREIRKAGLMASDGIIVGKHKGKFLLFGGQEFVSMIAPTRTGKGTGFVMPNLLNYTGPVVCLDPKLELFKHTSLYRQQKLNQQVYLLNPFSLDSHQYNPLWYISDVRHEQVGQTIEIGHILYPEESGSGGYWSLAARDLFVGVVLYLCETPALPRTLPQVLRIGSGSNRKIKALIRPDLSSRCVDALNRYLELPEKTAGSVKGNFIAALTPWSDPITDAVMSGNSFDLRSITEQNISIYVGIPANKIAQSTSILNLFFTQLINLNTNEFKHTKNVLVMMDEMASIGYLPILDKSIGLIAGAGLRLAIVAQSVSQLSRPVAQGGYGQGAKTMLDQIGCNIVYTSRDVNDAKMLSETLGNKTVTSVSRQIGSFNRGTRSDAKQALQLPQNLLDLPSDKQIIIREGLKVRCDKIAYYDESVFVKRMKSVCPKLEKIRGRPTHKQLDDCAELGMLSVPVPHIDITEENYVMPEQKPDFSSLPEVGPEPMTETAAEDWAKQLIAVVTQS